jgi:hypothetical protein
MGKHEITRVWCAVDFKADLRIFDKLYVAANHIKKSFPHWQTDRFSVTLVNKDKHQNIQITANRIAFEAAMVTDLPGVVNAFSSHLRNVIQELGRPQLTRLGIKVITYCDLELKFEELKDQIRSLCIPEKGTFEKIIPSSELLDLALVTDYKWDSNKKAMFRAGPMKSKQGKKTLSGIGNLSDLFPASEKSSDLFQLYQSVPEAFLYLDLDVFMDSNAPDDPSESTGIIETMDIPESEKPKGVPFEEWTEFSLKAVEHISTVFKNTKNFVLEKDNDKV